MRFFNYETELKSVTIYPIVCMHVGVEQCAEDFIREHIQRILADPNGLAVYMGDAGECNIKTSVGDIYGQELTPGEQLDKATELLKPLADADKLLFGIRGNHGARIYKATGLDWDEQLCLRLGIPFLETSVFMRLLFRRTTPEKRKGHSKQYHLYFHHGASSSINTGGKVNAALKFNRLIWADALFTAHTHICADLPVETVAFIPPLSATISWRSIHSYVCGCGYDSRSGYAEEKGYQPILPAYIGVTFSAKDINTNLPKNGVRRSLAGDRWKKQTAIIYRAQV